MPVIVHTFHGHVFHSYFGKKQTKMFLNIERGLAEHTSRIIAISQKQKDELCDTFKIAPSDKFSIIPLGFDLQRFTEEKEQRRLKFRTTFNIADDEVAIGIVGRLAPVKNHHLFIDAIAKAKKLTQCKLRAFIIGDGELKDGLMAQCAELGLSVATTDGYESAAVADVTFTSWIRNVEVVYPGLDVVAMTSLNEGTPVSLIEAQAANVPIVTTNVGGIENIVLPDDTAVLAANGDADDFVEKLLPVAESAEMRQRMSVNGWTFVKDKFHYTRLVADVDRLYQELLADAEKQSKRQRHFFINSQPE